MRECLDDEARLEDFAVELKQWQYDEGGPQVLENFIAFEGLDGAGTSTQARLLEEYFVACGHLCERSAEPTQGATGRHIRAILRQAPDNAEALIQRRQLPQYFATDRVEHILGSGGVWEKVGKGWICISERYIFSSLVYQGLDDMAPISLAELWRLNRGFPLPQHYFYLDIAAEVAEQRIFRREITGKIPREVFEQQAFLSRVRKAYLLVLKHFKIIAPAVQFHCLNAAENREDLQQRIQQCLSNRKG